MIMKESRFKQALLERRIVPAVKHIEDMAEVLNIPWVTVIILLGGDINRLEEVLALRNRYPDKYLLVHIDLIDGIGKDEAGIRYLKRMGLDGIVSVKWQLLHYAKKIRCSPSSACFWLIPRRFARGLKSLKKLHRMPLRSSRQPFLNL